MEGIDQSNQGAASYLHRMSLRSRDAPSNAPRISYAEDRDNGEDEEEEYDQDHNKKSSRNHGGGGSHANQYNGHRFGRRGDPRMQRALQIKLANLDIDVTLALIWGGYRYDLRDNDKAVDEDGITLGQRHNQLTRRLRYERRKADGSSVSNRPKREAASRKKAAKRKKTARSAGADSRKNRGRQLKHAAERAARSVSFSPPPSSREPSTLRIPTPPLPSMSFASNLDDPYGFARMESSSDGEYPPLPPLPGGDVEIQEQLKQMQDKDLCRVDSPYISDICDVEQEKGGDSNNGAATAQPAAVAATNPFPTFQYAPLTPSRPISRFTSITAPPPKEKDDTESVVGENLLEEDMLGLTSDEKKEAHDDVHGFRRLDSSLLQTMMSKFLCLNEDSVRASVRENRAIGKSAENLMSPAVKGLVRQMKVEIEARPIEERDAMLKAFVRCSPAQRQAEFGDERLTLFLHREHMNPVAAAARFVRYWRRRRELFGPEKYALPLTIDGALRDDRVALEVGHWIILPEPDNFGRTMMLWIKRGTYEFDSMVSRKTCTCICRSKLYSNAVTLSFFLYISVLLQCRALFYIAEQAILLPSSRKGIVWLSADLNTTIWKYDRRLDQVVIDFEEEYMPMEIQSIHVCSVQGYLWRLLKPVILACFSRRTRERLRIHLSSDGDITDILQGYGIDRSALPSILGGEIDADEIYGRWLKDRGLAQWHIYSCTNG